jgi:hypothetical protein
MGWRGAIRSIAAAQRAAERQAVRRHREHVRMAKQDAKLEALRQAAFDVEQYENLIDRITSVHRDSAAAWHWNDIANAPKPIAPQPTTGHETSAQQALRRYEPSWIDKLFRRAESKRAALAADVVAARQRDAENNAEAERAHADQVADWAELRDLALRILAMDVTAFRDATNALSPFAELSELGSRIEFTFREDGVATASLFVNGESVIPGDVKTLLQSGKLSVKRMPQGRFYELYQDYVAGATLRIARELFALLPLHTVYVTAIGSILDASSGHVQDQAILSVMIPRESLMRLRFDTVDASESLRNFIHRMDFRKAKGFLPVEPLVPSLTAAQR